MNIVFNALKGAAMGIAEVIPGVSGGTIAFISGIYERLLQAIKSFNFSLIPTFKKEGVRGVWRAIDGVFLFSLLGGMALGLLFGLMVITHFMETHPEPLWGFFFGLILASIFIMMKEIKQWKIVWTALLAGAITAFVITVVSPAEGNTSLWYVFVSGMLAICALMLPGISGSFILLLLGMYAYIIHTLKDLLISPDLTKLIVIAVFGLGCIIGLTGFSRVLTWLFKNYQQWTLAAMVGFLFGSLNKIWPWRNTTAIADKETGLIREIDQVSALSNLDKSTYKIVSEQNVLPHDYMMADPKTWLTIFACIFGLAIVLVISRLNTSNQKA